MTATFSPPVLAQPRDLNDALKDQGYAVLDAHTVAAASGCDLAQLNAFKYLWRAEKKGGKQDIDKAIWYLRYSNGDDPRKGQ